MNASARPEVLLETDHVQEHHSNPSVDTGPHELCPNEPAPPRGPVGPDAPGGGAFETFGGGAGI
jgi:hypothetical protein